MKNLLKDSLKVISSYIMALVVFVIFLVAVISLTRDNFYFWLPIYSFVIFLLLFSMLYSDLKRLAIRDKRPQYNLKPYPLKGLVLGIIGFTPVMLMELAYPLINFRDPIIERIGHAALNTLMGPLYFIIRMGKSTTGAYIVASLAVPVVSMLSYMVGYYGIDIKSYFKKKSE